MNDYEVLRVIEFLEQTREPFRKGMALTDDEPIWNITLFLMKAEIRGQTVTVSTLAGVTGIPYATSMRLITRMVDAGMIARVPRGKDAKGHVLHPGPEMRDSFRSYAGASRRCSPAPSVFAARPRTRNSTTSGARRSPRAPCPPRSSSSVAPTRRSTSASS